MSKKSLTPLCLRYISSTVYNLKWLCQYRRSPIGFFNPAIPTGIFPQSRNPDGFYRLIPIPVIFSPKKKDLRSSVPDSLTAVPADPSTNYLAQLAVSLCTVKR